MATGGRKPGVSAAQVEQRRQLVFEMMLQGMRPVHIDQLIQQNAEAKGTTKWKKELDWNVGRTMIERYYIDALDMLRDVSVVDARAGYRRNLLRLEELYRRCLAKGDENNARACLKDIERLQGLNAFDHSSPTPDKAGGPVADTVGIELPGGQVLMIG